MALIHTTKTLLFCAYIICWNGNNQQVEMAEIQYCQICHLQITKKIWPFISRVLEQTLIAESQIGLSVTMQDLSSWVEMSTSVFIYLYSLSDYIFFWVKVWYKEITSHHTTPSKSDLRNNIGYKVITFIKSSIGLFFVSQSSINKKAKKGG